MRDELIEAVLGDPAGVYVDATFGRGGHAEALLARLEPRATLLVVDRDEAAIAAASALAARDPRVRACRGTFSEIEAHGVAHGVGDVTGIMMDVGVSSPQLDVAERGFSFLREGPLDMRMDQSQRETAASWLNRASERDIAHALRTLGEERHARRIARAIVARRPLANTADLVAAVRAATPPGNARKHPATRTFQAVRMVVNRELEELEAGLAGAFALLAPGGALAVLSFHSLEHRLVRRTFRTWCRGPDLPRRLPVRADATGAVAKVRVASARPSAAEAAANPRARSALLQAVERLEERA